MADSSTIVSTRRAPGSSRHAPRRASRRPRGVNRWRTRASRGLYAKLVACSLLAALLLAPALEASTDVDSLLQAGEAPDGVVFEIVEADESALDELLPKVRAAIEIIRTRFPGTEFAVVSHGREEFALQSIYQQEHAETHQLVQSLVAEDVPVHVCATHAGWYGIGAEDFPAYVDVAPTGPGQVNLYLELGYELIIVD